MKQTKLEDTMARNIHMIRIKDVTPQMISDLSDEAGIAGDRKMMKLCKRAAEGNRKALRVVRDAINECAAQHERHQGAA